MQTITDLENKVIHQETQIDTLLHSLSKMRNTYADFDTELDKAVITKTAILKGEVTYLNRKLADTIQTLEAPKPMSIELLRKPTSITDLLDERMQYFGKMQDETIRAVCTERRMTGYVNDYKQFIQDFGLDAKWKVWKKRNK